MLGSGAVRKEKRREVVPQAEFDFLKMENSVSDQCLPGGNPKAVGPPPPLLQVLSQVHFSTSSSSHTRLTNGDTF